MSDPEKSGAPDQAPADLPAPANAPAEAAPAAPAAAAPVSPPVAFGSFGASRGSGLARGKRPPSVTAAAGAPATSAGYKPTAVEVITPVTEYKNPFTGETSVNAPRANEPVTPPAAPPPPAPAIQDTAPVARTQSPVPESSASLDATARSDTSVPGGQTPQTTAWPKASTPSSESPAKPELNILPPENARRAALRWEANPPAGAPGEAAARPDDRRTFQPSRDRREGREGGRPYEAREPRQPREGGRDPREQRNFEPREPRRDDRKFEPRSNQPQPQRTPHVEPEKKTGGFIGWLKGIFGGKSNEPAAPQSGGSTGGEFRRDYEQRQGGHRGGGGRGRGGSGGQGGYRGEYRGPRDQQDFRGEGGQGSEGGENRGEQRGEGEYGGQRRRRRRGGRGRYRGEGGGDRGGPRPEGQQGGGAI